MAMPSRPRLMSIAATVPTVGHKRVNPSVYLSPIAQPTSNSPAMTRINQAMCRPLGLSLDRAGAFDQDDVFVITIRVVDKPSEICVDDYARTQVRPLFARTASA